MKLSLLFVNSKEHWFKFVIGDKKKEKKSRVYTIILKMKENLYVVHDKYWAMYFLKKNEQVIN